MKKSIFFAVVCVALTFMACGSGSTTTEATDSTTTVTDTLSVNSDVVAPDTTAVKQ